MQEHASEQPTARLERLKLSLIHPSDFNFTRDYTSSGFLELRETIEKHGLLEPPKVRASKSRPGMYETIFGDRRLQCLRELGTEYVDCLVEESSDDVQVLRAMVIENVARESPVELEIAEHLQRLAETMNVSFATAGESLGFSADRCSNYKRLLEAPDVIKKMSTTGQTNDLRGLSDMARALEKHPTAERAVAMLAADGVSSRKIATALRDIPVDDEEDESVVAQQLVSKLGYEPTRLSNESSEWKDCLGSIASEARGGSAPFPMDGPGGDYFAAAAPSMSFGGQDSDDNDDVMIDGSIGGSKAKAKPGSGKKKTSTEDDDDKAPRMRDVEDITLEPIFVVYKEKRGKNGKAYTPDPEDFLLLQIKTGKQTLEFKLNHSLCQLFLMDAESMRNKIASGTEGERRQIICAQPRKRSDE